MTFEPITRLEIENYGCIRKASFDLSPLHALIGPNDSGKSTTLRAIRTVTQMALGTFENTSPWRPFDPMLRPTSDLSIRYADNLTYRLNVVDEDSPEIFETAFADSNNPSIQRNPREFGIVGREEGPESFRLKYRMTTATMIRFDPNALRRPSKQILAHNPISFSDETGEGLASVYQAINTRDVDAFVAIRARVRELFPTIQSILVPTIENNQVALQVRLTDNTLVPAPALSEGLLYFLGYLALQYQKESGLFLIEEPENGLHPARIAEVMSVLREISKTNQVIIATHSPLVVNELEGHEVSVVTRHPENGTQATLLKDTSNYDERRKIYLNGELWVAYGDGNLEAAIVNGGPRPWVRDNPELVP